jgi:hypothetical protein
LGGFITVRLTNAADLDFRLLPIEGFQDLDLSWWGWFLSPEGQVYGVFGGRDEISDATRISKEALENTLLRILNHHYDPHRAEWGVDGPRPDLSGPPKTVRDLPGFASWYRRLSPGERAPGTCTHCHQIADILRTPAVEQGRFDKLRDVQVWPLPENIGIKVDRDDGLLVTNVFPDSPAARAGLRAGDRLGAAEGRRLFSQADFRGILHRGPVGAGSIGIVWLRDRQVMEGKAEVQPGWRMTDLGWRMSISQGVIGCGPGFFPLGLTADKRKRRGLGGEGMAIEPYMGPNTSSAAYQAGLRGNDVVIAVNGVSTNLVGRPFLVWFRQRFEIGDHITLTVKNSQGETRDVGYMLVRKDEP